MKKVFLYVLMAMMPMALLAKSDSESSTKVRWGTFNIRLKNAHDDSKGVGWDVRRDRIAKYVLDKNIEVCGMQEVTNPQLLDLLERLPGYDYVGVGRTDGKEAGEYTPVFFKKDRFEPLEKGNFWLSETPEVPGSKGWDAALERVASYVKLKDKQTGKVFMAVNTHFDHVGEEARKESAKLIMKKIQQIVATRPAVVTGDFNVTEDNEAYKTMTTNSFQMYDAYYCSPSHTGATHTWHDFCTINPIKGEKIDFIFITPSIRVKHTHIERENPDYQLSDHNPHWADLEF